MKTTKILTIVVVALSLIMCQTEFSVAEPMGTAFTYQGHLYDANYVADGLYDFAFKLYDANTEGNKLGTDVNVGDVDVIDGYFTVELDFGSGVFDGNACWLEIGVRPGDQSDPCAYTAFSPRQEITPTPYALYAKNAGSDSDWQISGNDMYSIPSGSVGIGTTSPTNKLEVTASKSSGGILKVANTSSGGYSHGILAYSGSGSNSWGIYSEGEGSGGGVCGVGNGWHGVYGTCAHDYADHAGIRGNNSGGGWAGYFTGKSYFSGNVGIGTTNPSRLLHIYAGDSGATPQGFARLVIEDGSSTQLAFLSPSDTVQQIVFGDESDNDIGYISYSHDGDSLRLGTNASCAIAIQSDGDVGIGTTSPGTKLDVNGQVKITGGSPGAGKVLTSDATGLGSWQTPAASGDITAVYADNGLTGGATTGDAHLNVGAGTGISVSADQVSLNTTYTDGRYVNEGQSNSVNSAMIVNDSITASDIATNGVGSSEIANGSVTSSDMQDGAALSEILDDDGSGSGLDADKLDGQHASAFTQIRASGLLAAGNTVTLVIPHYTPWTLQLSSGWPDFGGVCFVQGFENDRYIGVTYIKYNGNGTSAAGGAEGYEGNNTTLVSFGSGSYTYSVKCPGEASGDHNISLTAAGVELLYRLIY